jgi:hypothetical protein
MQIAGEMGRAILRIERRRDGSGVVGKANSEPIRWSGIAPPVAPLDVDVSVQL